MKLHYFVREFSESVQFPEVHIFATEEAARAAMVAAAREAATFLDAWITEELDGPSITHVLKDGVLRHYVNSLNVQREGGAVDCFRLFSQDVPL